MGSGDVAGFEAIVGVLFPAFTAPTAGTFLTLVRGWVLCLGRPTILRLYRSAWAPLRSVWLCARFFRGARWAIEEAFREAKQLLGFGKVQGWTARSVERQAPFALCILSLGKAWYIHDTALHSRPEELPATSAMLTALRMAYWRERISAMSIGQREKCEILAAIQTALSTAA